MVGLARDSELFPPVAVGWKEMLYWDQALTTPAVMFQSSQAEAVVKLVADVVVLLLQNGAELVMFSFDDEFDMDAVPVALGPVVNGPKTPEPDVKLDEAEVLEELRPLPLLDTDDGIVDVVLPLTLVDDVVCAVRVFEPTAMVTIVIIKGDGEPFALIREDEASLAVSEGSGSNTVATTDSDGGVKSMVRTVKTRLL
ncbi:hypothetical protein H2204_002161 [Knufia peltigerae]|uniref:Uncharacterized protein n=1 Tax=Knufia peltigerae TaxID=1002370 RepID=A0AA38YBT4_9EURO|nr:hypothetical protein H2204_002161 [Knufia peltigerae]